jgi:cyclopropane fatty-acyl-phospholipid synthase-like methyltransferase
MTFFHIRKYFARPTSEIKTAQVNALAVKEGKTGLKKEMLHNDRIGIS